MLVLQPHAIINGRVDIVPFVILIVPTRPIILLRVVVLFVIRGAPILHTVTASVQFVLTLVRTQIGQVVLV